MSSVFFFLTWSSGHVRVIYIKMSSKKKSICMDLKTRGDGQIQDTGL